MSSGSLALARLRRRFPEVRTLGSESRVLEVLGAALKTNARDLGSLVGFAGEYAAENGCRSGGPVKVGASTWVHRSADGSTQVWHRPPTQAEIRALAEPADQPVGPVRAAHSARPASESAKRCGRLFR